MPAIQDQIFILGYDHDAEITKAISQVVDMRVIWGGDQTIETIRQIPLAPYGRELIFPDRFSWSAFNVAAYQALTDDEQQLLAEQYFNDLFWFDQAGCASPRIILWCGKADKKMTADFYNRLDRIAMTKRWQLDEGSSVAKQTRNYEAMADFGITEKSDFGSTLTVFTLSDIQHIQSIRDNPCFGGTLFELCIDSLKDITPMIERRDQTLTYFGFDKVELEQLAQTLNGNGLDRLVPIGQALSFDTIWDGYDLPEQFTRHVTVKGAS